MLTDVRGHIEDAVAAGNRDICQREISRDRQHPGGLGAVPIDRNAVREVRCINDHVLVGKQR